MPTELEAGIYAAVERAARDRSVLDVPSLSKSLVKTYGHFGVTRQSIAHELIRRGIEARANIEMDSRVR